ncbi:cysteine rich repeat-containing protein [Bdellovibrio sp. SKB1291214]|uniref:cysteine rich repeat-containing protein n=1 Tax=Bdellovibrio sp. SKB1291214 TaxID=1732569 RepID=UPI000B5177DB|nr:cysteine rich repeat-containing protein [Bdellovibrio sp. SKB1291214]UYL08270.1 cysteine rich repeat-containing protein [Bdellovibrio sp. SKB1291214]
MKSLIALCAFTFAASFATVSYAQSPEATPPVPGATPAESDHTSGAIKAGPCAKDMDLLCPGVTPGPEMHKCMKDNRKKISKECKSKMGEMHKAMKGLHQACHEDAEKYCSDVEKGKGAVMKCMKEHKDELSQACKDKIENVKAKHGKHK